MKKFIVIGAVISLTLASAGGVYSLYRKAVHGNHVLSVASMVTVRAALDSLNEGDVGGAKTRLEAHYYAIALSMLESGVDARRPIAMEMISEVASYRASYATNEQSWTVTESRLEDFLQRTE